MPNWSYGRSPTKRDFTKSLSGSWARSNNPIPEKVTVTETSRMSLHQPVPGEVESVMTRHRERQWKL